MRLGRWISGLRIAAAWLAGIDRMHWQTLATWNALRALAWATVIGSLAYFLGPSVEHVIGSIGLIGGGLVAVMVATIAAVKVVRGRDARPVARTPAD